MNRRASSGRPPPPLSGQRAGLPHPVLLKQSALSALVPGGVRLVGKPDPLPSAASGTEASQPARETGPSLLVVLEQNETLRRSLAEAQETLRQSAARHEQALRDVQAKSYEDGMAEGQRRARDAWRMTTDRLDVGLREVRADFTEKLGSLEPLALDVAAAALEAVLSNPSYQAETMAALVRTQLDRLSHENILAVILSPTGLPDPKEWLASLQASAPTGTEVRFDASLAAGSCEIQLATGSVDAGTGTQLANLRQALERSK